MTATLVMGLSRFNKGMTPGTGRRAADKLGGSIPLMPVRSRRDVLTDLGEEPVKTLHPCFLERKNTLQHHGMQFVEQFHIILLKFVQWYCLKVLKFLLYGCQTASAAMAVIEESLIQIVQNSFRVIRRLYLEHFHEPLVADWEEKFSRNPKSFGLLRAH